MQNKYKIDVLSVIRADIVTCELKPGQQIREAEASERYGASRTPVREALIELAAGGFVTLQKNKGAVVAPLDAATVFAVFEARIPVEKAAAALAAVRASSEEREALGAFRKELAICNIEGDLATFFAIDKQVHDALCRICGNDHIARQVRTLRAHTARCWHFYRRHGLEEEMDASGLTELLTAVKRNEPERAAEAMRAHLTKYLIAFKDMLVGQMEVLKWV
ncbi:MAG: GntR family transcriptional regulator [Pseudomonadota bacterium]